MLFLILVSSFLFNTSAENTDNRQNEYFHTLDTHFTSQHSNPLNIFGSSAEKIPSELSSFFIRYHQSLTLNHYRLPRSVRQHGRRLLLTSSREELIYFLYFFVHRPEGLSYLLAFYRQQGIPAIFKPQQQHLIRRLTEIIISEKQPEALLCLLVFKNTLFPNHFIHRLLKSRNIHKHAIGTMLLFQNKLADDFKNTNTDIIPKSTLQNFFARDYYFQPYRYPYVATNKTGSYIDTSVIPPVYFSAVFKKSLETNFTQYYQACADALTNDTHCRRTIPPGLTFYRTLITRTNIHVVSNAIRAVSAIAFSSSSKSFAAQSYLMPYLHATAPDIACTLLEKQPLLIDRFCNSWIAMYHHGTQEAVPQLLLEHFFQENDPLFQNKLLLMSALTLQRDAIQPSRRWYYEHDDAVIVSAAYVLYRFHELNNTELESVLIAGLTGTHFTRRLFSARICAYYISSNILLQVIPLLSRYIESPHRSDTLFINTLLKSLAFNNDTLRLLSHDEKQQLYSLCEHLILNNFYDNTDTALSAQILLQQIIENDHTIPYTSLMHFVQRQYIYYYHYRL